MNEQKRLAKALAQGLQAAGEFYKVAVNRLSPESARTLSVRLGEGASVSVEFIVMGRTGMAAHLILPDGERMELMRRDI